MFQNEDNKDDITITEDSIISVVKRKVIENITKINNDKTLTEEERSAKLKKMGAIFSKVLEAEKKEEIERAKNSSMLPMYSNYIKPVVEEVPFDVRVANFLNSKGISGSEALGALENRELLVTFLEKVGIDKEDAVKIAIDKDEEVFKKVQLETNKVKFDV